jgi:hypothetical protein
MLKVRIKMWRRLLVVASFFLFFCGGPAALAATPTLSAAYTGSGDTVQLSVTGDANTGVILNYLGVGGIVKMSALGITNAQGVFSLPISTGGYGIAPGSLINISINNVRSDSVVWPYGTTAPATSGSISLGQTSVLLNVGQSTVITVNNTTGNALFLSKNSAPAVANVSFGNNQITVSGITAGSTSLQFCSAVNASTCATLTVNVTSASAQAIGFSQNNVSVVYGQNMPITITGGAGSFIVTGNTNPAVIQATVNGSVITLYALTTSGSATITVCTTTQTACGVIIASAAATTSSAGTLSLSQQTAVLTPGQVLSVTVSGGTGSYYISSNSNSTVVQANIVNATLTLFGNSNGSANVIICAVNGGCVTLPVTVSPPGTLPLVLTPSTLSLSVGQSTNVVLSGAGGYAVASVSNSSVVSALVSGSTLVVSGSAPGSATVTVCQTGGACGVVTATVAGVVQPVVASTITVTHVVTVGQEIKLLLGGGSGIYSLSSSLGTPFIASLTSGNILVVRGTAAGTASVNVCVSGGSCSAITVTVSPAPVVVNPLPSAASSNSASSPVANSRFVFLAAIVPGDRTPDVVELQKRLKKEGVFTGDATGFFGAATLEAVKKYQTKHGLNPIGTVGPATRAALNEI